MALVSSAPQVSNQSATPIVKGDQLVKGGKTRSHVGLILAASMTGGTVGQWYTFARIPVRARLISVNMTNATTTTGAVKAGLYRPDGIAIDDACLATNVATTARQRFDLNTVPSASARATNISTAFATAIGTAGATADVEVDIALAIVTVIGTPVDVMVEVEYELPE